jgi:hypothetical protein
MVKQVVISRGCRGIAMIVIESAFLLSASEPHLGLTLGSLRTCRVSRVHVHPMITHLVRLLKIGKDLGCLLYPMWILVGVIHKLISVAASSVTHS